jgi:hypothetical protein
MRAFAGCSTSCIGRYCARCPPAVSNSARPKHITRQGRPAGSRSHDALCLPTAPSPRSRRHNADVVAVRRLAALRPRDGAVREP